MASGIEVNPEITELYNDMKLRKKFKYVIFHIKNKKSIEIEASAEGVDTNTREECQAHFEEMCKSLTDLPRYVLYDFKFAISNGRIVNKLAFIFYSPDDGPIGAKMIYASSKDALKKGFTGLGIEFQANDRADLDFKEFADEIEKKA